MKIIICNECKREFSPKNRNYSHKFCSTICYHKFESKNPNSGNFKDGNIPWNKDLKGWRKGEKHPWLPFGSNHWNWKGGISKERDRIKHTKRYKNWRKKVFEFDDYVCWICEERGGNLEAHHLFSWTKYPSLRYKINNGITLHKKCHQIYTF